MYQKLVDLAGNDSSLFVPEGHLSKQSVVNCFKKLAETNYIPFQGYLKCGNLGSRILLSPSPLVSFKIKIILNCKLFNDLYYFQPFTKKTDFDILSGLMVTKAIEICGFISVADVGSPSSVSRHLILPLPTDKTSNIQGVSLEDDSDIEEIADDGRIPSFCVLLHGALKVNIDLKKLLLFKKKILLYYL